jgi:hypothetical protein
MNDRICRACGAQFAPRTRLLRYCDECRKISNAVYRFICPDGRSYVGSTQDLKVRKSIGLSRSNRRIKVAIEKYPPETWVFELLEPLPHRCSIEEALKAEQRHIDRLGTLNPERGFNVYAARSASYGMSHSAAPHP